MTNKKPKNKIKRVYLTAREANSSARTRSISVYNTDAKTLIKDVTDYLSKHTPTPA